MKSESDENVKTVNQALSASNENSNVNEKFIAFFRSLKRNVHIERFFSNFQNSIDEKLENVELLNINELRKIKLKNRSKNSKNQKFFITRAKKKAIKSTRRNFFEFEYVEAVVETFQSRDRSRKFTRTNRVNREEREGQKDRKNRKKRAISLFIITQKLQAFKKKTIANKAKKQQKLNQTKKDIKTIEEKNKVIKKSVRFMISKHQSIFNKIIISDERSEQLSDHEENFMMLNNNNDSDYDDEFDDEIIEDMNI